MAALWVGQNSDPISRLLWPKVHRIKFACAKVSVVCNAVFRAFRLTMSCCVPEIFATRSRSCAKSRRNFDVFGPPNFGGRRGHPNFWPTFINLGRRRPCGKVWWRSAKRPQRWGGEKKKNRSKLQWWNGMAGDQHSWRAAIISALYDKHNSVHARQDSKISCQVAAGG